MRCLSRWLLRGIAVMLLLALPERASAEELIIGMSAAFKGPSAGLGSELYRGAMASFSEVNAKGGIHGRTIVLKALDDGYNPPAALENTIQLVEKENAYLLFGYVGTPTTMRVMPLLRNYQDRDLLLFFPFTGASQLRVSPFDRPVFSLRASYHQETAGLVDRFVSVGRKRIGVFYQIDSYGRSGREGVSDALAQHGLTIVGEATYRRGTPFGESMARQVQILRESGAEAVICVGAYAACAAFVRDARNAGWNVPIANLSFVGSENLLALLQSTSRDYTANLYNSQVVPSYHNTDLPAVKRYRLMMDKHKPEVPDALRDESYHPLPSSFVSLEGYLDAELLIEILRRLGPEIGAKDRKRLPGVVESIKDFDLGIGPDRISFGPERHQGSDRVYFTEVRNGRFVSVGEDWGK